MRMYNSIEHSNNYLKTSGSLWQQYRETAVKHNDAIKNIPSNGASFKSKVKITGKAPADGRTKDVQIAASLTYLNNFWRTLEISLINCEINLILTWSSSCATTDSNDEKKFAMIDTKLYVPAVILSTKDNAKLLEQLKSGFHRKIN